MILAIAFSNLFFIYLFIDISVFIIVIPGRSSIEGLIIVIKISPLVIKWLERCRGGFGAVSGSMGVGSSGVGIRGSGSYRGIGENSAFVIN